MKNIIAIIVLLLFFSKLQAQDLIITTKGDSLNCKITAIQNDIINYSYFINDSTRNKTIARNQVKSYEYNYYHILQQVLDPLDLNEGPNYSEYPHFKAGFNFGLGYRTAKISDNISAEEKAYVDGLLTGYNFGIDAYFYITDQRGIGIRAGVFRASNSIDNISVRMFDGTIQNGSMKDDIRITYFGPAYSLRLLDSKKKNSFFLNFSIGYIEYTNFAVLIENVDITSSTTGMTWDIGYDWVITKNMAIGIQMSYFSGQLTDYDFKFTDHTESLKLENGVSESLQRLDFSIGLRFNTTK